MLSDSMRVFSGMACLLRRLRPERVHVTHHPFVPPVPRGPVPEGDGVGLSALDEGGHPARALGPQESLGLPHERPRDPLAPDLARDGESVDVAAPAVEAADDAADDAP